jgi:hypothetical protein
MRMKAVVALTVAAVASTAAVATAGGAPGHAVASTDLTLTPLGIGHLRVGMTVEQARRASGRRIVVDAAEFTTGCRYAAVRSLRVYLMLLHGRIARIDVARGSPVHALGGIRRGDTEADVRAAFGPKVVETQHAYVPAGSYLTVGWRTGPYAKRGIRFETNERGTVTDIYAGRHDPIRYIEGCA